MFLFCVAFVHERIYKSFSVQCVSSMSYANTASTSCVDLTRVDSNPPIKRVVLINIYATPSAMDSLGGDAGSFALGQDQAVKIFARSPNLHPDVALNEIKNVMLRKARILEYKTNAPDVCALQIEGLPGNEYTQGNPAVQ